MQGLMPVAAEFRGKYDFHSAMLPPPHPTPTPAFFMDITSWDSTRKMTWQLFFDQTNHWKIVFNDYF